MALDVLLLLPAGFGDGEGIGIESRLVQVPDAVSGHAGDAGIILAAIAVVIGTPLESSGHPTGPLTKR